MARRSAVRHGSQTAAHDRAAVGSIGEASLSNDVSAMNNAYDTGARGGVSRGGAVSPGVLDGHTSAESWDLADEGGGRRPGRRSGGGGRWRGAGGRWWVWVGRAVLWAFILVVLVNGIRAPFERFTADKSPSPATVETDQRTRFPSDAASAYALQFAGVYLNYDEGTASEREQQLRFFVPEGAGQLGWNGIGQLRLQAVQVTGVDVRDANNAIVTLLANTQDKWLRLAVPIYAKDGAMVVSGRPALLPAPPKAALPQRGDKERDTALETELQRPLEGFFRAYGSSDTIALSRFSDQNSIIGLDGSVAFARLREVTAPNGGADERRITVTVTWRPQPSESRGPVGEIEQTYELTVVKKAGTWYVRDISGSTQPTGP